MKQAGALEPLIDALLSKDPGCAPRRSRRSGRCSPYGREWTDTSVVATVAPTAPFTGTGRMPSRTGSAPDSAAPSRGRRRRGAPRRRLAPVVSAVVALAATAGAVAYVTTRQHGDGSPVAGQSTTAATPSAATVPDGYHLVSDKQLGVSLPLPDGWKAGKRHRRPARLRRPHRPGRHHHRHGGPGGAQPRLTLPGHRGEHQGQLPVVPQARMQRAPDVRGQQAAVWEFTFKGRVRVFRAIDIGYGREGGREYDIYLSAPDAEWDTYRPVFDHVRDGLRTSALLFGSGDRRALGWAA